MVFAAQDKAFSPAHPNVAHPAGTGNFRRPSIDLPDSQGPKASPRAGGENPGLSGSEHGSTGGASVPPSRLIEAVIAFLTAIRVTFVNFDGFVVEEVRSRRWASSTFQGARHDLVLRFEGDGAESRAERLLGGLDARDFALRGHLLADISLVSKDRRPGFVRLRLEALTVEEK